MYLHLINIKKYKMRFKIVYIFTIGSKIMASVHFLIVTKT